MQKESRYLSVRKPKKMLASKRVAVLVAEGMLIKSPTLYDRIEFQNDFNLYYEEFLPDSWVKSEMSFKLIL